MGRRTTRGRKVKAPTRPSWFFVIALVIGLALLAWFAVKAVQRPMQPRTQSLLVVPGDERIATFLLTA